MTDTVLEPQDPKKTRENCYFVGKVVDVPVPSTFADSFIYLICGCHAYICLHFYYTLLSPPILNELMQTVNLVK